MSPLLECISNTHTHTRTHGICIYTYMKDCNAFYMGQSRQAASAIPSKEGSAFLQRRFTVFWMVLRGVCLTPVIEQWLGRSGCDKERNATGKSVDGASTSPAKLEFLQVYWFSFWNTIWKVSFKFMSENIFKQGCGKDMFMVDTVSFPSL